MVKTVVASNDRNRKSKCAKLATVAELAFRGSVYSFNYNRCLMDSRGFDIRRLSFILALF